LRVAIAVARQRRSKPGDSSLCSEQAPQSQNEIATLPRRSRFSVQARPPRPVPHAVQGFGLAMTASCGWNALKLFYVDLREEDVVGTQIIANDFFDPIHNRFIINPGSIFSPLRQYPNEMCIPDLVPPVEFVCHHIPPEGSLTSNINLPSIFMPINRRK
jgi:hypothetical protein